MKPVLYLLVAVFAINAAFAQLPPASAMLTARVGVHSYSVYDHYWPGQQVRNALNIKRLSASWIRLDVHIADYLANPTSFLQRQQKLLQSGLQIIYVVLFDLPDKSHGAFGSPTWISYNAGVVATVMSQLDGPHIMWEVYNEPNLADGQNSSTARETAFIALQKQLHTNVQSSKRSPTIIGPAVTTFQPGNPLNIRAEQFVADCRAAGITKYWAAISYHLYGNDLYDPPENRIPEIEAIQAEADGMPLVVSETGSTDGTWQNNSFFQTDRALQARQVVIYLLLSAAFQSKVIVLYQLNDMDQIAPIYGLNLTPSENYFGLFSSYYEPGSLVNNTTEKTGQGINTTARMTPNLSGAALMKLMQDLQGYAPVDLEVNSNATHFIARYVNATGSRIEVRWSSVNPVNYTGAVQQTYPYFPVVVPVSSWTTIS